MEGLLAVFKYDSLKEGDKIAYRLSFYGDYR